MTSFHAMLGVLQLPAFGSLSPTTLLAGVIALLFLSVTMLFVSRYRRCPAHQGGLPAAAGLKVWRGRRS